MKAPVFPMLFGQKKQYSDLIGAKLDFAIGKCLIDRSRRTCLGQGFDNVHFHFEEV
jgi:hypothetical protein